MAKDVLVSVKALLKASSIPIMGVADARTLNEKAPIGFKPEDLLPGAKSVMIFARPLPVAAFLAPGRASDMVCSRSALNTFQVMDSVAGSVCLMLEKAGSRALPVPAYSPLRFYDGEPRGLISLKHAAVEAGLGSLGRNTLLLNPDAGNVLRLGGLVTTMDPPAGGHDHARDLCPEGCHRCSDACPVGAIGGGAVDKLRCMGRCVRHALLPPAGMLPLMKWCLRKSEAMSKLMELITLNFFETYGLGCTRCIKACPYFPGSASPKGKAKRLSSHKA